MGKRSRLPEGAVLLFDGQLVSENPFRQPMVTSKYYTCGKCGDIVSRTGARDHIRKCWKYQIKDTDPIPATIPEGVKQ